MSNFELVIPYPGTTPSSLDYYFDHLSRQLVLAVITHDQNDWRHSKENHFVFEKVQAFCGSSVSFDQIDLRMNGIYRVTGDSGKTIAFAFRYSVDGIKYVYASGVRQI